MAASGAARNARRADIADIALLAHLAVFVLAALPYEIVVLVSDFRGRGDGNRRGILFGPIVLDMVVLGLVAVSLVSYRTTEWRGFEKVRLVGLTVAAGGCAAVTAPLFVYGL